MNWNIYETILYDRNQGSMAGDSGVSLYLSQIEDVFKLAFPFLKGKYKQDSYQQNLPPELIIPILQRKLVNERVYSPDKITLILGLLIGYLKEVRLKKPKMHRTLNR